MENILKLNKSLSKAWSEKIMVSAVLLLLTAFSAFAQSAELEKTTDHFGPFSNALFATLFCVIILLLIIIAVLGGVLKNVAGYYGKNNQSKTSSPLKVLLPLFILVSLSSFAQGDASTSETYSNVGGLASSTFNVLVGAILLELLIIGVLIISINTIIRTNKVEETVKAVAEPSFLEKINASVAIEKEEEIMFDHEYDGIRELDNDLPPWWRVGFYITIVIAFVYMIHYHVIRTGDLQLAEYNKELEQAEYNMAESRKKSANLVDETNVRMLKDEQSLAKGKELFISNCAACHGKFGEGGVGPNMTDEYWIHGGSIKDVFKTIKYGVVEKGMKSWEADFSPSQMNQLASYIETLVGTNPSNGKEKQGSLYKEEAVEADSVHTVIDSLKATALTADSVVRK